MKRCYLQGYITVDRVDTSGHMTNEKPHSSISTQPVDTKLGRMDAYDCSRGYVKSNKENVIFQYNVQKRYISTSARPCLRKLKWM